MIFAIRHNKVLFLVLLVELMILSFALFVVIKPKPILATPGQVVSQGYVNPSVGMPDGGELLWWQQAKGGLDPRRGVLLANEGYATVRFESLDVFGTWKAYNDVSVQTDHQLTVAEAALVAVFMPPEDE